MPLYANANNFLLLTLSSHLLQYNFTNLSREMRLESFNRVYIYYVIYIKHQTTSKVRMVTKTLYNLKKLEKTTLVDISSLLKDFICQCN